MNDREMTTSNSIGDPARGMVETDGATQKLQFRNGYAEIRDDELYIAVDGHCKAMSLGRWMDAGWGHPERETVEMQSNLISDMIKKNEELARQCDELREIALRTARALR